jgi:hypothetical protein
MTHEHDWDNFDCATCDTDWFQYQTELKDGERKNLVFIFDCVDCANFYGEQTLTPDGRLLCPSCFSEQTVEADWVEAVQMKSAVEPFATKPCQTCGTPVDADIHAEELGFCVPCQHAYFDHSDEG